MCYNTRVLLLLIIASAEVFVNISNNSHRVRRLNSYRTIDNNRTAVPKLTPFEFFHSTPQSQSVSADRGASLLNFVFCAAHSRTVRGERERERKYV